MKLQFKFAAGFAVVALLALGVAWLGFWQVRTLGQALYEVGVVRLPSLEGLHMIAEAHATLQASLRATRHAGVSPATLKAERRLQAAMWVLADRGWALYEPLPQTPEEALKWKRFAPAWKQWRAHYEAAMEDVAAARPAAARDADLDQLSDEASSELISLIRLNRDIAEEAKQNSVASQADVWRVQHYLLLAAGGTLLCALAAGWVIGRMIARPAEQAAKALGRVAAGDLSRGISVDSKDELGEMAGSLNVMIETLRNSEARLRALADNLPNGVVYQLVRELSGQLRFAYVSAGVERLNGVTVDAVLEDANLLLDQILPEDRAAVDAAREQSFAGLSVFTVNVRLRRPDGELRWVQFCSAPRRQPDGTVLWDGIEIDFTERQRTDEALRRNEAELRRLFDNAPIGISLIKDRTFLRVNAHQCRLFGYTEEEFTGMSVRRIYFSDEQFEEVGRDLYGRIEREGSASGEVDYRCKDGSAVHQLVRLVPVDRGNPAAGVICLSLDITEQKRLEKALRDREREMVALLEAAPVGIFLVKQRTFARVNRAMSTLFGRAPAEFEGASTRLLYANEEEYERVGRELRAALAVNRWGAIEVRGHRGDGTEFDLLLQAAPLDRDNLSAGQAGICIDITERKRAAEALRESEARLNEIFDHTTEFIFVVAVSAEGAFTYQSINRAVEQLGLRREDFVAGTKTPLDLFGPATAERLEKNYRDCAGARRTIVFEQEIDAPVGKVHTTTTLVPVFDASGERVVRIVGFAVDTTERKRAEEALRASEEKYRGIVEHAIEGIFQMTPEGRLLSANPALARLHGYDTPEQMIAAGRDLGAEFQVRAESRTELLQRLLTDGVVRNFECEIRRRDGEHLWLSINAQTATDSSGRVYIEGTQVDITAQRRAAVLEAANARAEAASRAKSAFLANMSHEIRTPMNAILGFAQLLMRDSQLTAAQREHLRTIGSNGEHLMSLINDVLEMSKIEASRATLHRTPFEVEILVRNLESMFRARVEAKGLALHIEVGGSGPRRLVGDAGKLRQIFVNLLSNALKFTLSGHITLRLRVEPAGDSRVQLTGEVQDTGPGIDPADLPSVFDAFEQGGLGRRSGAGTGLGLPISREFARMMQGDITVVSAPGEGSVFRLDACLAAADPGHGPAADRPTILADQAVRLAAGQPEQRVLVVDDQKDSRQFLLELLTGAGFAVREADDGERAVELCGRWRPHAVLMDVRMPGMDGLTAIREIRRQDRERRIKIISLTASVFAEDREGVLAAGADSFLLKPVRIADVLHELGGLLSLRFVQTGIGAGAETPDGSIGLLETLPAIAPELAERLRISVAAADLDQILATIAELQPEAPAVAARLGRMANHFDYDGLLRAVAALARPPV